MGACKASPLARSTHPKCYHSETYPTRTTVARRPSNSPVEAGYMPDRLSPGRGHILSRLSPPCRRRASWRPTGVRPLNVTPLPQAWNPPVRRLAPGCCGRPRRSRALMGRAPVTPGPLACARPAGGGASAACRPHPAPSALRAGLGGEPCESPARALREPCESLAPHYNALWRSLKALRLLTVQMSFAHSFSSGCARRARAPPQSC